MFWSRDRGYFREEGRRYDRRRFRPAGPINQVASGNHDISFADISA
jgi:hypothetical protein